MNTRFLLMLVVALSLQACTDDGTNQPEMQIHASTDAETMVLKSADEDAHYVSSGTVTSDHRVSISSRISGYIRQLSVREGDHVNKGQVLVRVDPVNVRQMLIQAEADLADAKADLNRYESLYRDHAASKQQLDRVRLRYKVARSQVAQARNQLGYAEVRSPVDGVVVEKHLSKGDLAQPGASILTLEDPSSLLVETYVSEQYISGIQAGDKVAVDIPSMHQRLVGIVRQVVEAADAVSHQFLIKITLQDESLQQLAAVHPGMYAQVGFAIGKRKSLRVPAAAIVERAGLHGIYIMDAKRLVHYRQIRIGSKRGSEVEVLAGLQDGDVIAWNGNPPLQTGMQVEEK